MEKRRDDWPFKGVKLGEIRGDFEEEFAELLTLAQLFRMDIRKRAPVLYLAELGDDSLPESIKQPVGKKEKLARLIQDRISKRLNTGKSFSDMLLIGWVYQFWRKHKRKPTVTEIAKLMRISRDTFYRRYTAQKLHEAYYTASGESKRDLPDPDGLDSVQRANWKAKKKTRHLDDN